MKSKIDLVPANFLSSAQNSCYKVPISSLEYECFFRNYFAFVSCGCQYQEKDKICAHCDRLEIASNVNVLKVCINEEDFPKRLKFNDFSLYPKTLSGNPFFVYNKDLNCIVKGTGSIDWGDFFYRERNDVNSLGKR